MYSRDIIGAWRGRTKRKVYIVSMRFIFRLLIWRFMGLGIYRILGVSVWLVVKGD